MKKILFILDSCRYDTYMKANTELIDKLVGPCHKGYTRTNLTPTSFVDIVNYNRLPQPWPGEKIILNYINYLSKKGIYTALFTDNPHIHTINDSIKGVAKNFDKYEVLGFKGKNRNDDYYNQLDNIIEDTVNTANEHESYYIICWTNNTHQPYNLDGKPFNEYLKLGSAYRQYNKGADVLSNEVFDMIKRRQVLCCEEATYKIGEAIQKFEWNEIFITADHGESMGENHFFGHGVSLNREEFEVPVVYRWRRDE